MIPHSLIHIGALQLPEDLNCIFDVFDIFVYVGGIGRSKESITKYALSPPIELSARLLDFCYMKIVQKQNTQSVSS